MRPSLRTGLTALTVSIALSATVAAEDRAPPRSRAAAEAPDQDLLLHLITPWLARNFDLPHTSETPVLLFAPGECLARLRYGPGAAY